jgi:hypothetical protein
MENPAATQYESTNFSKKNWPEMHILLIVRSIVQPARQPPTSAWGGIDG